MTEAIASWIEAGATVVGALGTLAAVIVAVVSWRIDRHQERVERALADRQRAQHMIVALGAEIEGALKAAHRQKTTIDQTIAQVEAAVAKGGEVKDGSRIDPTAISVTDAIVYRALAPEIGRLPPEIIRQTTSFYHFAREMERVAMVGGPIMNLFQQLTGLLPRLLLQGELVLLIYQRFGEADFRADTDLKLKKEEMIALANAVGYPIEEIARERGIEL
jgi:alkylation response protein AidB-like acyl-CoA dehydrogenase